MKARTPPSLADAQEEIASLIEVLRSTDERLEVLTAGQVDAVASKDGQTFLMRKAQARMRESEPAKQEAILNALPAHIALLDTRGVIIAVNRAWREFSSTNGFSGSQHGVGANYLQVCDSALGPGRTEAHHAAFGIRQVLNGAQANYSLSYTCHSPTEKRWFQMTTTALTNNQHGAVVMHENVTDRNRLEKIVLQSEQHFHFLDDLSRATRTLVEPAEIMSVMTRMLGEHLKASRCAYADVKADGLHFTILHDYTDGCASTVGEYELSTFGARAVSKLSAARTLVIRDVHGELSHDDGARMFASIGIGAIITCPLVKGGQLRALMAVHQTTARDWTPGEIAIVEEVVERCWAAIERRVAEDRQREGEALLRIAGRTARLGAWALDIFESRVTWSEEICTILEVPLGTVIELQQALSFYEKDSRATISRALDECLQRGMPFDLELQMLTSTGRAIWVRCAGEANRNHLKTITQARGAFQDITDRKLAEAVLQTSMEEFRTLAEAVPQIVWITRPDGWNLYINQHWADYTGLTIAESLGHQWIKPFHPDDQQRAAQAWQLATSTIGVYSIECRLRRADGAYRWWLVRGVPFRDNDGTVARWFGTCTDIHDLKMAELAVVEANKALGESERRFSHMLGNVQLVSIMLDDAGRITYCNDFFLELTGWQSAEVMGRDWFELFLPQELRALRDVFTSSLVEPPTSWHRQNEIVTRSGERRVIRWNITLLRSAAGEVTGTASIGEDITESMRAEISIKQLNRVYSVLSGINALIVRAHDRDELFREACRIAVDVGGFRMAMICMADPSSGKVVPLASAGKDNDLMDGVRAILSSPKAAAETRITRAMQTKQPVVSNDWLHDSGSSLHAKYVAAGVRSLAVLPLLVAGESMGVLALYANEAEFFHREEMKLLTDLTADIAFAIDHIEKGERLSHLAYFDALTGLANRVLFHERLTGNVRSAHQHQDTFAVVLLDVERLRTVNDSFGRDAGDALLREVSARLVANAADDTTLARIDADHFALVLPATATEGEVAHRVEQMVIEIFGPPFKIGETELRMSAKVGVALYPNDGADADGLLRSAEAALTNAKASPERYLFYTHSMNERVAEKLALENQLRRALENEEFVLHYQPKIDLETGRLSGCEALIRWNDPNTGLVAPGKFIPILEETGLIFEVGRWALRQAIADGLRWRSAGLSVVRVAVNVSPLQLRNRAFIAEIQQLISVDAQASAGLELEITEGMIMEDTKNAIASLQAIRDLGVTIAIDDFGTGFSSLSYLAKLPVDTLKIDRSFVNDMNSGTVGLALVSTIITLAHSVRLKVVAEGVETEEQARLLRLLKCDEMQGFLISKAVPREIFEAKYLAGNL